MVRILILILYFLCFRPHFFDSKSRATSNPHRKAGSHDRGGRRGAESFREQFHKCNHEKIKPHIILNVKDEGIMEVIPKNAP